MNIETMIEIPAGSVRDAIRFVYELSDPQGLGLLHFKPEPLTEEEIDDILSRGNDITAARMDYVNGRSCKFAIYKHDERLFIPPYWHDHSAHQLITLLGFIGVENGPAKIAAANEAQALENERWDTEES